MGREKSSGPNGQLLKSTKISKTKELGKDSGGWLYLSSCVAGSVFVEIVVYEVDALTIFEA